MGTVELQQLQQEQQQQGPRSSDVAQQAEVELPLEDTTTIGQLLDLDLLADKKKYDDDSDEEVSC